MSELTPVAIEQKLRSLVTDLTRAQLGLQEARDREVTAKHAYQATHRRAMFSPECPKPGRGGPTVDERNAWVDEQACGEQRAYDIAEAARKAAEDHLRTLRDQSMIVAVLAKSVHQAYNLAGVS